METEKIAAMLLGDDKKLGYALLCTLDDKNVIEVLERLGKMQVDEYILILESLFEGEKVAVDKLEFRLDYHCGKVWRKKIHGWRRTRLQKEALSGIDAQILDKYGIPFR